MLYSVVFDSNSLVMVVKVEECISQGHCEEWNHLWERGPLYNWDHKYKLRKIILIFPQTQYNKRPGVLRNQGSAKLTEVWSYIRGFPDDSDGKKSACNAEDPVLILQSRRSPGEGNSDLLPYSSLENSMDREAWWSSVHGIAKSWTWLSDYHFTSA